MAAEHSGIFYCSPFPYLSTVVNGYRPCAPSAKEKNGAAASTTAFFCSSSICTRVEINYLICFVLSRAVVGLHFVEICCCLSLCANLCQDEKVLICKV